MSTSQRPTLRAQPQSGDSTYWHQLLGQLDPTVLTETFLTRVTTIPGYDPSPVPLAEIRRTGRLTFQALIDGLSGTELPGAIPIAHEIGVSRARAGVPITALITAIRLDFAVLWESLTAIASPTDAELIVRHTGIVLNAVDAFASQAQTAYASELQRMREDEASVRRGLIAALFQDLTPSDEGLSRIARELGLLANEPLMVAAAVGEDIAALRVAVAALERNGVQLFTHHLGDSLVVFRQGGRLPDGRAQAALAELAALRIGVSAAETLGELRRASATARDLARQLRPGEDGAMTWQRGWARLAAEHLLTAGNPILDDVNSALEQCGPSERSRLEEAVRSYLSTGSVVLSAKELFCHRNTVANRLHRFAELTGVDPSIPADAARLVVGWA